MTASEDTATLADRLADVVLAHPSVQRLDRGEFGMVATRLPGREVPGIRVPGDGGPLEMAVVLRLDRPLPEVIDELRTQVRAEAGSVPVDITVSDVVLEQRT